MTPAGKVTLLMVEWRRRGSPGMQADMGDGLRVWDRRSESRACLWFDEGEVPAWQDCSNGDAAGEHRSYYCLVTH